MNKKLINISIDDVSPHPMSSIDVLRQCDRILRSIPDAKFTLFVPAAYWRTIGHTATQKQLTLSDYPSFCSSLKNLDPNTYEICYHGYNHGIPNVSNNDELQSLSYENALVIIEKMINGIKHAGLFDEFKPILRPPAWRLSPGSFKAAYELGIKVFALSPDSYAKASYSDEDENYDVVYYNCAPPFKPLKAFANIEVVTHACVWDRNYLSNELADDLIKFILENDLQPAFIGELIGKI